MAAWFYILRLKSGALYTGATTNIQVRHQEHLNGTGCRTTTNDPPDALIYSEEQPDFPAARKREAQVKRWTRAKKLALASGNMHLLKRVARLTRHGTRSSKD